VPSWLVACASSRIRNAHHTHCHFALTAISGQHGHKYAFRAQRRRLVLPLPKGLLGRHTRKKLSFFVEGCWLFENQKSEWEWNFEMALSLEVFNADA
jgi:hypothetical protein